MAPCLCNQCRSSRTLTYSLLSFWSSISRLINAWNSASVVNEVLDFYIESASWPPPERKKKRKSRWANDEADKTFIPGMPTVLPADATEDQKEQYIRKYFISGSGIIWTWNGLLTAIFPNLYEIISFFIKYRVIQYVHCGD